MTIVLFYYLKDFMSSSTIIDEFKMDIDMASDLRLNNSMFNVRFVMIVWANKQQTMVGRWMDRATIIMYSLWAKQKSMNQEILVTTGIVPMLFEGAYEWVLTRIDKDERGRRMMKQSMDLLPQGAKFIVGNFERLSV